MMRTVATISLLALLAACSKPADTQRTDAPVPAAPAAGVSKSKVIAKGTSYREADYAIPGKIVLLDFYADW